MLFSNTQVENQTYLYSEEYDENVAVRLYEPSVKTNKQNVSISMVGGQSFWHLFYPGQVLSIEELRTKESSDLTFLLDYVGGKIGTVKSENGNRLLLEEYQITYEIPEFDIKVLKQTPQEDPTHIKEVYLQLPDTLPERVGELSRQISEGLENRYDKVKAIEHHFSKNTFSYETENIAIPDKTQDYVDQFLFETQEGYCDNFSTSMVVMLRSIDIPARWVKGFTDGNRVDTLETGDKVYEITNENAHSWVEVYFNDVGWVPFEPTIGFRQPANFFEQRETDPSLETDKEEDSRNEEEKKETDERENPFLPPGADKNTLETTKVVSEELNQSNFEWAIVIMFIILLVTISIVSYRNYQRILTLLLLFYYKKNTRDSEYTKRYERLLWLLKINGIKRFHNETLREYAERVDVEMNHKLFSQLTHDYECCFYGQNIDKELWKKNKDLFLSVIRTIAS